MSTVDLPRSSADIDATWVDRVLREGGYGGPAVLESVTFEPVNKAVNLMGEIVRAHLTWSDDDPSLPESVIIKLPSPSADNHALSLAMGYYEAEHQFYTKLSADAGLRVPRRWFTGGDAEVGHYAVVMEDLGHLDIVDQSAGLGREHTQGVMGALARMHGRWWMDPDLEQATWLPQGFGEGIRVYGLLMQDAWPSWAESASEVLDDDSIQLAERFVNGWDALIDATIDDPWTLIHRDFRVDNMAFDGTEPIVFDWGSVARGGGLYDLAYFLGGSLDTAVRRQHQDELVRTYRDELADAGGDPLDDDEFVDKFRVGGLFCLVVPILAGGNVIDAQDDQGRELVTTILTRTFELLHDIGAEHALPD